ncbi:MAG: class II aldolase/adducin family protein [Bdellovibrionales bacterium]
MLEVDMLYSEEKKSICEIAKRLYDKNLLAAADGNISLKVGPDRVLITPSGKAKAFLNPEDISLVDLSGVLIEGLKASSESKMHLSVYRETEIANAVIHAHPPSAIAWTIAEPTLDCLPDNCISELILAVGKIPFVPYARPGTEDMGNVLKTYITDSRAMILRNHGALSWGETLEEAWFGMERIEHTADILYRAKCLGSLSPLPEDEIDALRKLRSEMGDRSL